MVKKKSIAVWAGNDRQGNDVTEYEVDREKSQKEEESPR